MNNVVTDIKFFLVDNINILGRFIHHSKQKGYSKFGKFPKFVEFGKFKHCRRGEIKSICFRKKFSNFRSEQFLGKVIKIVKLKFAFKINQNVVEFRYCASSVEILKN